MQPQLTSKAIPQQTRLARPKYAFALALLIVVVTFAVYRPVNRYDFADVDDDAYITENVHIKYGLDWDAVKWSFTTFYVANWHPVTWLSHDLDCQWFHLNAGRQHNMNVALHTLNALLLFWILLSATGYAGRSAVVGALFALHPVNVESVVWIAERKNILSLLFFLLALAAYHSYARRPSISRYLLVAFLFAAGLMSKPQVITLPFVLLLWDYWPLGRMFGDATKREDISVAPSIPARKLSWLIAEKLPLFPLAAASAVLTIKAQRAGGAMNALNSYPLSLRMANAVVSYVRYLDMAFWPSHLAPFYPYPRSSPGIGKVIACGVLLLSVTAFAVLARQRRYLATGWLWFLGTLVPMIGLVQVGDQSMADRYAYLPFLGLFIMCTWGVADIVRQNMGSRKLATALLAAPTVAILLALLVITHRQIGYWRDSVTLWSHTLQVTNANDAAENYLGQALLRASNPRAAIPHFQNAIAIMPDAPKGYMFLGYSEQQVGDPRAAIRQYQKALALSEHYGAVADPIRQATLANMAFAYRDLGDFADAQKCLEAAREMHEPQ